MLNIRFWAHLYRHPALCFIFLLGIAGAVFGAIVMMVLFMKDPTFMRGATLLTCYAGASGVGWFGGSVLAKVAVK